MLQRPANRLPPHTAIVATLVIAAASTSAFAFSIDSVKVGPADTVTPDDPVVLEIQITTPSTPGFLYQSTDVVIGSDAISVVVFADSGQLTALDTLLETVELGRLDPGTYSYTVELMPAFDVGWGTRSVSGTFVVTGDVCLLPADPGPCDGDCPRFYFNAQTEACESFGYGCCEGNANNFLTVAECEAACPSVGSIPATSEWGLAVLLLLILTTGTIACRRHPGLNRAPTACPLREASRMREGT